MALPQCVSLADFDMVAFLAAGSTYSVVNFIWQPPGCANMRVDTKSPVRQNEQGWAAIAALTVWADRTDPGGIKRAAFYQKSWDERTPGQAVVTLDKIISQPPLQMSRV